MNGAYTVVHTVPPTPEVWVCTRSWERTQPGQLTPSDLKDISFHMTSCSSINIGGKKEEWGHLELWYLSLHMMEPCFPGVAKYLSADAKQWLRSLLWLVYTHNCNYSVVFTSIHMVLQFCPFDPLPHSTDGKWVSGCLVLGCSWD